MKDYIYDSSGVAIFFIEDGTIRYANGSIAGYINGSEISDKTGTMIARIESSIEGTYFRNNYGARIDAKSIKDLLG